MAQKIVLSLLMFLILLLLPVYLPGDSYRKWIVWNVGQGQWVTLVEGEECVHFDVGGEFAPWNAIREVCGNKLNRIYLSHWDTDHISFVAQLSRRAPSCLASAGPGPVSRKKQRRIQKVPACSPQKKFTHAWNWRPIAARSANDWSQVFSVDGVLLPGDSTKPQEKQWVAQIPAVSMVRLLILGHHGSRTSTSVELMARLKHLRMAVSSAREKRYGHPHAQTVELLRRFGVPLLRTEDWGTIVFEI